MKLLDFVSIFVLNYFRFYYTYCFSIIEGCNTKYFTCIWCQGCNKFDLMYFRGKINFRIMQKQWPIFKDQCNNFIRVCLQYQSLGQKSQNWSQNSMVEALALFFHIHCVCNACTKGTGFCLYFSDMPLQTPIRLGEGGFSLHV